MAGADYDARGLTYEKLYEMREVFLLSRIALGGNVFPNRHEILVGRALGTEKVSEIPVRRQPQGRVHDSGQHGRRRASGNGSVGEKRAGGVAANTDAAAVEL